MSIYPARLVVAGIAKEPAFGTPAAPVVGLAVDPPSAADHHSTIADTGWRQSTAASYGHQLGVLDGAIDLGGPLFVDAVGWGLAGVLGSDDVTGLAGAFTHSFTLLNSGTYQPPSYTVTVDDPVGPLAFPGCRWTKLAITADFESITWSGSLIGMSAVAGSAPPQPTVINEMPGWSGSVMLNGVVDAQVLDFSVNISRAVTAKRSTDGSRTPRDERAGLLTVTGGATVALQSDAYRALFLNASSLAVDASWAQTVAGAPQQLTVHSSACVLDDARRDGSGDWVEMTLSWTADANAADAGSSGGLSPVKVTLVNAVPSGYYT